MRTIRRTSYALAVGALAGLIGAALPAPAAAAPLLPSFPIGALAYTVNVDKPDGNSGNIFYTTGQAAAAVLPNLPNPLATQSANVIIDKSGREIWRYTPPAGQGVSNFRTQMYKGHKVLTWWQGTGGGGHGSGTAYIADDHYRIIETIPLGDGLTADAHEFRLTPDGRALITSYKEVTADLTSIGGARDGKMFDCIASVVDVATKKVLFHWSAMQHVPLTDSQFTVRLPGSATYDPFHMNAISLDPAGNLVISMRNTSAIYNVDPDTGAVNWQLGGTHSTLELGPGVQFGFQHDAEFDGPTTLRLFNNNSSGLATAGLSSVQWINIDRAANRATLVRNQTHPAGMVAFAMGNAQALPNGNTFVGWGMAPRISEFSPTGELLYDASLPQGTYRAFFDEWTGHTQ